MISKKQKLGKERLDKYYYLAKEYGYRSRAAFKLIQLNKKYQFLDKARAVVDLCAAPGGWCQVVRKYQPMDGTIVGVDLDTIPKIPNVQTFVGDITTPKCAAEIRRLLSGRKADVVLHDGSPNVGANWFKDAYTQIELVVHATKLAANVLRPGGMFISKVFRSRDYTSIIWLFNQLFNKVEATKPKASRHTSAEIYLVGLDFKAPKSIDQKLFNPNVLFEEIKTKKSLKELAPKELAKRRNRNREGYEDDAVVLFKNSTVAEFIDTETPISFLSQYYILSFTDAESKKYENLPETTKEIKILCQDLKVLGMVDFKLLLKWRQKMRQIKDESALEVQKMDEDVEVGDEGDEEKELSDIQKEEKEKKEEEDSQPRITAKMKEELLKKEIEGKDEDELKKELEQLKDRARKVKKNLIRKARIRSAKRPTSGIAMVEKATDMMDTVADRELFALSDSGSAKNAEGKDEGNDDYDEAIIQEELKVQAEKEFREQERNKKLTPEEFDKFMEEKLEALYLNYLDRKGQDYKTRINIMKIDEQKEQEDLFKTFMDAEAMPTSEKSKLLVDLKDDAATKNSTNTWFAQNAFDVLRNENEEEEDSSKMDEPAQKKRKISDTVELKKMLGLAIKKDEEDDDDSDDDDNEDEYIKNLQNIQKKEREQSEIEMIPKEFHDEDTRAETMALAKKLLEKKTRQEFIENAYNKRAFNDRSNLPNWFVDDELDANVQNLPTTKEDVLREKNLMKELNVKPIKKVLEAEFRKKRKNKNKLLKIKETANAIADNPELTNQEKGKELQKLYKKAQLKSKPRKVLIVAGHGAVAPKDGSAKDSVRKFVDRRLKKDKRSQDAKKRKRGE